MKSKLTSAIGLLLLFCSSLSLCGVTSACRGYRADILTPVDSLKVTSTSDLMPLVRIWAEKFSSLNPAIKISVAPEKSKIRIGSEMISFTSENGRDTEITRSGWNIVVGHNAVIPLINSANPMKARLMVQGLSPTEFGKLMAGNEKTLWSDVIEDGKEEPVHKYYVTNDAVLSSISKFAEVQPDALTGIYVKNAEELLSLVEKDIYSIGFCRLSEITQENKNKLGGNISLLPVDRNGNGRIDSFESIYDNLDELNRGIWIGKYPSALCGSIYAICNEKPAEKNQLAFLSWIITDGSGYLNSNGFVSLAGIEKEAGLASLNVTPIVSDLSSEVSYAWVFVLASIIALVIIISVLVTKSAKAKRSAPKTAPSAVSAFNESMIASPMGLLFDKSHTWTFMERDGLVRFGVDDFIQHITGTITGIRLKEPGDFVRRGEKILSIVKDGKQIELYSPISGKIKSLNTLLYEDPSVFNSSPYSEGWIYLIEPKNWAREMQLMFMADKYRQWLTDEFDRLKTFLGTIMRENSTGAYVIMQDGGEMTDHVLSDLEPEVWEDFQRRFIDTSR